MSDINKETNKLLIILERGGLPKQLKDITLSALQASYLAGRGRGLEMAINVIIKKYQKNGK